MIIATHQAKDVEALIDRVLILHEGKFVLHQSVSHATAGLRFAQEATRPNPDSGGLLYVEPVPGGFASVWAEPSDGVGPVDLELLFKAAIADPGRFTRLFPEV